MAIDPQIEALLNQLRAAGRPPLWEQTPEAARLGFRALTNLADKRDVPIGNIENRAIPVKDGEIGARSYTPVAAGSVPLPVLVYYHGGGFVIGDLDTHDTLCRALAAEAECKVISIDYRRAPEHKFPTALEDAFAAVQWVENNASSIGIDPNHIAIGGDSAGATLSAAVAQMAKEKGAPKIVYQMLFYPAVHVYKETESRVKFADDQLLHKKAIHWFRNHYYGPGDLDDNPRAAPIAAADLSGLPPAYVMTAGNDPLLDEGRAYAERLREAGVPVEYVCYEQAIHGFLTLSGVVDTARVAISRAAQALKAALA